MRFFLLFVTLWTVLNVDIAAATQTVPLEKSDPTTSLKALLPNAQNNHNLYPQLFKMQSQIVRLDEKLQQQKTLGNDVKNLEATQQALKVQLANLHTKIEAQDKLQENQLNGFDGRIGDVASNTNMWGIIFTILGLIIAVAAGFLGYSAKNRAVYEAKQTANAAAENHMQQWLTDNKDILISKAKTSLEDVSLELKGRAEKLETQAKAALDKIERELIEESKRIVTSNKDGKSLSKNNTSKIERSAQDWFREGLTAFSNHEYDDALNAWKNVLNLLDITKEPYLYATTMFNQSITYRRQDNSTDELNNYSMLIEQFKASDNEEIQVQVARAMLNQGATYGQQDNSSDELNSYSMLIEQFKASDNEEIQVEVARAMLNQGITYRQQDNSTDELNSYSMLIEQFKASDNEEIQVEVARAMLNQGVTYGEQDNSSDALNSYSMLIERFKTSDNTEIQIQVANAINNQLSVYSKQENFPAALQNHQELITQFKDTDNEELKNILNDSLVNIAEIALLYETSEQVLHRVMEAEAASENPQHAAIIQFIRFLLEDKVIQEVFNALMAIPKEIEIFWQFSEIQDYLNTNFDGEKQQQIQAVVAFFEEHKDIEKLRNELGLRS